MIAIAALLMMTYGKLLLVEETGYAVAESQQERLLPQPAHLMVARSGNVAFNHLELGARVHKDQILLELESGDCLFRLEETRAQIRRLEDELASAQAQVDNHTRFERENARNTEAIYRKRNHLEKQLAGLYRLRAELAQNLDQSRLRAPFDGIIGMIVEVQEGSEINAGLHIATLIPLEENSALM